MALYLVPRRVIDRVQSWFLRHQVAALTPHLSPGERLLDFGCGNGRLAQALAQAVPQLIVTGADVVDASDRPAEVPVHVYDGRRLPFADGAFDTVLAYHVFHHCDDPEAAFAECARVAGRRVLLVEPTYRSGLDLPVMRFTDWLFNAWKPEPIPMPYQFRSRAQWQALFRRRGWRTEAEETVGVFPGWLPAGRTLLFSVVRADGA